MGQKTFENYDEQKTFSFRLFKITNKEKMRVFNNVFYTKTYAKVFDSGKSVRGNVALSCLQWRSQYLVLNFPASSAV